MPRQRLLRDLDLSRVDVSSVRPQEVEFARACEGFGFGDVAHEIFAMHSERSPTAPGTVFVSYLSMLNAVTAKLADPMMRTFIMALAQVSTHTHTRMDSSRLQASPCCRPLTTLRHFMLTHCHTHT